MIFFFWEGGGGNNAIPSSWTLKLPESWGESKTDFKREVDRSKIKEGGGVKIGRFSSPSRPSSLSPFFFCLSRWRPRSMYLRVSVKKRQSSEEST